MNAHMAGIIPIANFESNFNTLYPSCLLPVDAAFSMIKKAVFECAIVGCKTIWIVANDDMAPIIRKSIGEWTHDPIYFNRTFGNPMYKTEKQKEIPIYYVPILPKDRERRDSYAWSALFGMHSAWYVAYRISKWIVPQKYYIAFPHSAFNIYQLRKQRSHISHKNYNFFLTYEDKIVKDNIPLSFTMTGEDFIECRRHVNAETTKTYYNVEEGEQYPSKKLPLHERWSARNFDFATVFEKVNMENCVKHELDWYYDISDWEGYREFLGSDHFVQKPADSLTKAHKHAILCMDEEENNA